MIMSGMKSDLGQYRQSNLNRDKKADLKITLSRSEDQARWSFVL